MLDVAYRLQAEPRLNKTQAAKAELKATNAVDWSPVSAS
jgi:hypothetical protein